MSKNMFSALVLSGVLAIAIVTLVAGQPGNAGGGISPPPDPAIAFTKDADTNLWVMNADGTNLHSIPVLIGQPTELAWSPDTDNNPANGYQGSVVFLRQHPLDPAGATDLSIVDVVVSGSNVTGQNLRQLVGPHNYNPAWSPLGNWIAFSGTIGTDSGIFVIPPSGGNPILVAKDGVAPQFVDCPTWDPSGTRVAYRRSGGSLLVKQVIDPTTGTPIPVVGSAEFVLIPPAAGFTTRLWSLDWSRMGDRIAFEGAGNGINAGIYVVDVNTGVINHVLSTDDTARSPSWSSDNPSTAMDETDKFLLYTQKASGGPTRRQIVRQKLDTGVVTILFDHKSEYPDQIDWRRFPAFF